MTNSKRKTLFFICFLVIFLTGLKIGEVLSQSSISTLTISSGVYPVASYTIWNEGLEYYSKDKYGTIVYSSTNGSNVIQNSIDSINNGTILLEGIINIEYTLSIGSNINFRGLSREETKLVLLGGTEISVANNKENITISDMTIENHDGAAFACGGLNGTKRKWISLQRLNIISHRNYGLVVF
jgi:hypothetical protein